MSEEEMENELDYFLEEMEDKMRKYDLSDHYLSEHDCSTRDEIGIGEYSYGITMIPCKWVYPYLVKLQASIHREKKEE